jgi:WD40 repeat protein
VTGYDVNFSADGRLLVVAGVVTKLDSSLSPLNYPQVQLWDVASQKRVAYFTSPEEGSLVAFRLSPDQQTLAVSTGLAVHIWEVRHAKIIKVLRSHRAESLEFDRSGMFLLSGGVPASGSEVGTGSPFLLLWDSYTGR